MEFISNSIDETQKIAFDFAQSIKAGDVITLNGDLGAGKTAFTSGLIQGLGVSDMASSPTFTIVNEYLNGKIPVYHFDLYRLNSEDELYDIGIDEYLYGDGICVFEWPQLVEELVENYYCVDIEKDLSISEDYRKITITKIGDDK